MSAKELKDLKEKYEHLREELKTKTEKIKTERGQIRNLNTSIKQRNQEIASLDAKGNLEGTGFSEFSSVLKPAEKEAYSNAFTRIVSKQLFEKIKSVKELKKDKDKDKSVASVDVEFEGARISFYINHKDTFNSLRMQVASYWALPPDEIFFSDQSPREGNQPLFLLGNSIIEELYVWRRAKVKSSNFLLHLVLRNYTDLKDRMELLFPKDEEGNGPVFDVDNPSQKLVTKKKKEQGNQIDKKGEIKKRKRWARLQYLFQWCLYVSLFLLWAFTISSDKSIAKSTWINKAIMQNLLWNVQFDDSENIGIYGPKDNAEFLSVTSIENIWEYISMLQSKMLSNGNYGVLNNNLFSLEYIEVKQVRTKVTNCTYNSMLNYSCADDFNLEMSNDKTSLGDPGQIYNVYTTRNRGIYIYGEFTIYPMGGYLNSINIQDLDEWTKNISALNNSKWLDEGTRAVMITMNIYNPSSDIMTMVMPFFEISSSGAFIQNFKIYSILLNPFSSTVNAAHAFILVIALILLCLELRENIRYEEELSVFIFRNVSEEEKLYDNINEHRNLNLFQRLKKPNTDQILRVLTLLCVFCLEVLHLSLYFGRFQDQIQLIVGYNNIFGPLQAISMMNDAKTLFILFLAVNVMKYIVIFMKSVSDHFQVIMGVYEQIGHIIFLNLLPLLMISVFMLYFLGPCDSAFSSLQSTFVSTIKIFCGQWPSNKNFQNFVDTGYLVIIFFLFLIWKTIIITIQAISFQSGIAKMNIGRDRRLEK